MVVTPSLNKSYKFASNWPENSSQIYLLERLVDDVTKDKNSTIKKVDDGYEIISAVNYPNNQNLVKEKIIVDSKYNVKEVYVYDKEDNNQLCIKISNIDYSPKFSDDFFELDSLVKDDVTDKDNKKEEKAKKEKEKETGAEEKTNEECMSDECNKEVKEQTTSNVLEEIIYPLYVPNDTYLKSKDTVDSEEGSRHILTFAGVDPFILVEEVSSVNDEMEIIPVNGEPLQLSATIGALQDNSLSWSVNGVDYYLTSSTLDNNEMMTIAESITNSTSLVSKTK